MELIESLNEQLQERLQKLTVEVHGLKTKQHEEMEARKQNAFDTRMAMEEILRKTIKYFGKLASCF
jgi:hypothetical protein